MSVLQDKQKKESQLFSNQMLVSLILPLMIEQFFSMSMGLVDTFMVAGIGQEAVSSVSLVDSINTLTVQILAALCTGGAVVTSQYIGRKDYVGANKSAVQLYTAVLTTTIVSSIIISAFRINILQAIFGSVGSDVMALANTYFFISALSYPFIGMYNAGAALFRAQGNSQLSMRASLLMNVINIGCNALFIYGCHMGVLGAALATLSGRIFAGVWVTKRLWQKDNVLRPERLTSFLPNGTVIVRILAIGIPSGIENGIFQIGKLLVAHLISTLGIAAIAANAVANSMHTFANIPGKAFGLAIIPLVGQCLGAGEKIQATKNAYKLIVMCYVGLWASNSFLYLLVPQLVQLFNLSPEATLLTVQFVRMSALCSAVLWPLSFLLPNVLRTGGDVKFTMLISIFSMWVFRIGLTCIFVQILELGIAGVWYGMFIDWAARGSIFLVRFVQKKWLHKKVI